MQHQTRMQILSLHTGFVLNYIARINIYSIIVKVFVNMLLFLFTFSDINDMIYLNP
jgi:hypothetical protein